MRRILAVVVVAAALIWGIAFSDPRSRPAEQVDAAPAADAEESVLDEAPAPAPRPRDRQPVVEQDEPESTSEETSPREDGPADPEAEATQEQRLELVRQVQAARDEEPGEEADEDRGEYGEAFSSPDYLDAARRFAGEPRHVVWAPKLEKDVREVFENAGLEEQLQIVSCRKTVCRLQLRLGELSDYASVLDVEGLTDVTDLGPDTPYSLRVGVLTVHFARRDGG